MGTPEFAVPSLREVARRCDVVAVVTQPDRPRGRGRHTASSEVAAAAGELGIEVFKPERMDSEALRAEIQGRKPDLLAVVAFGAILDARWLGLARLGAINLHGSLLPDYRGASPVQRALWDGRAGTGVTTIWMDAGIDTGDLILQRWVGIETDDNAETLARRLAATGAPLLAESLIQAAEGRAPRRAQDLGVGSYARKLRKRDGHVDWTTDAVSVWQRQRAVTPWPGAATMLAGKRLTITRSRPVDALPREDAPGTVLEAPGGELHVACGRGALEIVHVKPEGRNELGAAEWARGARVVAGDRFEPVREHEEAPSD
jgi:methionyl-tRNA formyltransferase